MISKLHGDVSRLSLALLAVGLLGACVLSARAADTRPRVRFSGTADKFDSPTREKERELERIMNATGRERAPDDIREMPYVPPPSSDGSIAFRNKKLQEWIDQRANWIFVTEDPSSKAMSPEEALGIDDVDFTGDNAKSKKAVERYWDNFQKDRNPANNNRKDTLGGDEENSSDKPRGNDTFSGSNNARSDDPFTRPNTFSTRNRNADPGNNFPDPSKNSIFQGVLPGMSPATRDNSPFSFRSSFVNTREERLRQMQVQYNRDFQSLLRPDSAAKPAGLPSGANDPINQMADTTRNAVQPVTAPTVEELSAGKSRQNTLFPQGPNPLMRGRQASWDDLLNAKIFGASSLSPTLLGPSTPLGVQPKPAVLEMPRRKF